MADWASLLRDLGLGQSTSTATLPLGMGQADFGITVQQFIQQALDQSRTFDETPHTDPHPAGLPQGLAERLIKGVGKSVGSLVPDDLPYLEQYLHPDVDVLPKTDLRPTRGGPPAPMTHRLPAPHEREMLKYAAGPQAVLGPSQDEATVAGGLGHATISHGDGYMSLYDKWDFDSPSEMFRLGEESGLPAPVQQALDWIIKQGMQRVGEPFAVYDRAPLTRK